MLQFKRNVDRSPDSKHYAQGTRERSKKRTGIRLLEQAPWRRTPRRTPERKRAAQFLSAAVKRRGLHYGYHSHGKAPTNMMRRSGMARTEVVTIAPDVASAAPTHPPRAYDIISLLQPNPRSIPGGAPGWAAQYGKLTLRSVFQPVMSIMHTRIIGYEAMARCNVGADEITLDALLARAIRTGVHDAISAELAGTGRH